MERRAFLGALAAGTAGALVSSSPALAALAAVARDPRAFGAAGVAAAGGAAGVGRVARDIKKAVKIGMVNVEGALLDKFKLLAELGFDGVELDAPNGPAPEEVAAAKAATGLQVPGVVNNVHWGKPFSHPDEAVRAEGLVAMQQALRDAKAYGASSVLLVPAVVNKGVSYAEAWDRSTTEIRKLVPLAEELGVDIAFENVWNNFLLSPLEAARYVDSFESERVGFYLDVGNIVLYGWPEQWVATLGHRIKKLDIKEYSRAKLDGEGRWEGFKVELLEGDCDWPAVMAALDEIGYSGWGTAEIPGGGRERLADIAERMDRIFAS